MSSVSINRKERLSQHFTLGELCKTSHKTKDGNIPSHVAIENLKRLCTWLDSLRCPSALAGEPSQDSFHTGITSAEIKIPASRGRDSYILEGIVFEGVEHRRQVALAGVGKQNYDFLAFVLRALGHLDGCEEGCSRRDTYQQTF